MRFIVVRTSLTTTSMAPHGYVVVDSLASTSYPFGKVIAECGELLDRAQAIASAMNTETP